MFANLLASTYVLSFLSKARLGTNLHEELHGVVGVVLGAVVVLLQDVEQAELLAVVTLQQLLALLHPHGFVDEAEQRLVALAQLQLLQHAANHVLQVHVLTENRPLLDPRACNFCIVAFRLESKNSFSLFFFLHITPFDKSLREQRCDQ